ncbi:uncharacterized protein LOC106089580 [Stomoxys calcitrans]|uniref:uncharacterized protein LOC106089580 n=1 Tax=Stomoxys calcitrans TaxID=35570 RepID=UPI0027E26A03|nr:uncharacterized protein LOC106089580 [Stomoxys calcitrans]
MFKQTSSILAYVLILQLSYKVTNGNVIFRFGFDFGANSKETSLQTSLQIGDKARFSTNNQQETFTTNAPFLDDIWTRQANLNATANDKLQLTQLAVTQLKNELIDVVDRSEYLTAKIQLMTGYISKVDVTMESTAVNRFKILQHFVELVDELRKPPEENVGGEKSLDYIVMKMGIQKHKLVELQTEILVDVLQAMEAWQEYVKTKMIDVTTV